MSSESAANRTPTPAERRLAAVVHADMVGYSRLIGRDDVGTLERLRTLRRDLINVAARTARSGRGHVTLHLPEGWPREHQWLTLFAACGPPVPAA